MNQNKKKKKKKKKETALINKFFPEQTFISLGALRDSGSLQNQPVYTWAACLRNSEGLKGGSLLPSKIALCSHRPTVFPYFFII